MSRFERRTGLAAVGTGLAVAALTGGCGAPGEPEVAPMPASNEEATSVAPARVPPVDLDSLREGPAAPEIGVPYPFDLYTHCGIEFARFGGKLWRASRPQAEPSGRPDANGITAYTAYTAGTMTLVGTEVVRFVVDERYVIVAESSVTFFPSTETPPLCR